MTRPTPTGNAILAARQTAAEIANLPPSAQRSKELRGKAARVMIQRYAREESAREAIGTLEPGVDAFILSRGQFSLVDVVTHVLDTTGPAHFAAVTWTIATDQSNALSYALRRGRLLSARFLLDFSFFRRKPDYAAAFRELFPAEAFRVSIIHAKFTIITNDTWRICVHTSANYNINTRAESYAIRDDPERAAFLLEWIDYYFRTKKPDEVDQGGGWQERRYKAND